MIQYVTKINFKVMLGGVTRFQDHIGWCYTILVMPKIHPDLGKKSCNSSQTKKNIEILIMTKKTMMMWSWKMNANTSINSINCSLLHFLHWWPLRWLYLTTIHGPLPRNHFRPNPSLDWGTIQTHCTCGKRLSRGTWVWGIYLPHSREGVIHTFPRRV